MQLAASSSTTVSAKERPNLDGVSMSCLGRSPTRHTNTQLTCTWKFSFSTFSPIEVCFGRSVVFFFLRRKGLPHAVARLAKTHRVRLPRKRDGLSRFSDFLRNSKPKDQRLQVGLFYQSRCIMSDIVFGGWSDTWRTDLGYASVRSPDIRPPPRTISYTYRLLLSWSCPQVNIVIGSKTSLMVCSMEFLLFKKKEWHFQSLKVPNLTGFQTFLGPAPRCGAHHVPRLQLVMSVCPNRTCHSLPKSFTDIWPCMIP